MPTIITASIISRHCVSELANNNINQGNASGATVKLKMWGNDIFSELAVQGTVEKTFKNLSILLT